MGCAHTQRPWFRVPTSLRVARVGKPPVPCGSRRCCGGLGASRGPLVRQLVGSVVGPSHALSRGDACGRASAVFSSERCRLRRPPTTPRRRVTGVEPCCPAPWKPMSDGSLMATRFSCARTSGWGNGSTSAYAFAGSTRRNCVAAAPPNGWQPNGQRKRSADACRGAACILRGSHGENTLAVSSLMLNYRARARCRQRFWRSSSSRHIAHTASDMARPETETPARLVSRLVRRSINRPNWRPTSCASSLPDKSPFNANVARPGVDRLTVR